MAHVDLLMEYVEDALPISAALTRALSHPDPAVARHLFLLQLKRLFTTLAALHDKNYCYGDLNEGQVLVTPSMRLLFRASFFLPLTLIPLVLVDFEVMSGTNHEGHANWFAACTPAYAPPEIRAVIGRMAEGALTEEDASAIKTYRLGMPSDVYASAFIAASALIPRKVTPSHTPAHSYLPQMRDDGQRNAQLREELYQDLVVELLQWELGKPGGKELLRLLALALHHDCSQWPTMRPRLCTLRTPTPQSSLLHRLSPPCWSSSPDSSPTLSPRVPLHSSHLDQAPSCQSPWRTLSRCYSRAL